ncbi:MAG: lysophospholipase [Lachnospiraceae bacterium]|nr:lysophospholipase [Lachnospiraceae bacterium]
MNKRTMKIPSSDGVHKLHVVIWEIEAPKAIVQISHGMVEFIERYEEFAAYLNERGFLVVGNDHLGHGQTAGSDEDLGYFCDAKSAAVVEDLHRVTTKIKEEYPNLPLFLYGHSMGSFMARRYLMTYGQELTGAIIAGTGRKKPLILGTAKLINGMVGLFKGERHRSKLMSKLAFGTYNKRIPNRRSDNDWLTRDEKIVDMYNAHKHCMFIFTVNGNRTLFDALTFIQKKENIAKLPKDLPVFMVAGAEDPVGDYGKGVVEVYESYKQHGIKDITLKLYEEDRHEILNELDRETVYKDVADWIESKMPQ